MGAKVLHPRCLLPAALSRIPVEVRNTLDPGDDAEITVVSDSPLATGQVEGRSRGGELPDATSSAQCSSSSSKIIFASGPSPLADEGDARAVLSPHAPGSARRSASPPSGHSFSLVTAHSSSAAAASGLGVAADAPAKILAVARRKGVTLLALSTYSMWGNAGFLAKIFEPFAAAGVSVDLIATSQYAVSLTLDHIPDGVHGDVFRRVLEGASGRGQR